MVLKAVGTVLCDLLERVAKFLVRECASFREKVAEIRQDLFDGFDVVFVAIDKQLVTAGSDSDVEK